MASIQLEHSSEDALAVMARVPRIGQVKSRLAKEIGQAGALAAYKVLLGTTLEEAALVQARRYLFYAPGEIPPERCAWPVGGEILEGFSLVPQPEGDLGGKIEAAFSRAFSDGCHRCVVIGADCPGIRRPLLEEAMRRLDSVGLVLGPAEDGGYYLIGLRADSWPLSSLFQQVEWGSGAVLVQTLIHARGLGLDPFFLPRLYDIDRPGDLLRWRSESRAE